MHDDFLIENKYSRWYIKIIENAVVQNRVRVRGKSDYYEKHHIRPRKMGGTDNSKNLVLLTYREHFLCHWLLTKCVVTKYDYAARGALRAMFRATRVGARLTGWQYAKLRKLAVMDDDTKGHLSDINKGKRYVHNIKNVKEIVCCTNEAEAQKYVDTGLYAFGQGPSIVRPQTKEQHIARAAKTRENLLRERGVINISQLPEVKEKIRIKHTGMKKPWAGNPGKPKLYMRGDGNNAKQPEARNKIKQKRSGTIGIKHEQLQTSKWIRPEEYDTYASKGWVRGRFCKKAA